MKVLNKKEFKALLNENPDGGIVFAEYWQGNYKSEIMITNGDHIEGFCDGVIKLIPWNREIVEESLYIFTYDDDSQFAVFDNDDIMQMIQNLIKGLKIKYIEEDINV